MKKEIHYLDEKYNKTSKEKAVFLLIRYLDEDGRMVREAFGSARIEKSDGDSAKKA